MRLWRDSIIDERMRGGLCRGGAMMSARGPFVILRRCWSDCAHPVRKMTVFAEPATLRSSVKYAAEHMTATGYQHSQMPPTPLGNLESHPRVSLGHTPTPLEPLVNLSRQLGGASAWVKRDDCTGLAFGGNKVRQLEYYLGEALAQKADTVLITGAVQSNFVRLTAAAAAQLGLECHIQLEDRVPDADPVQQRSGNVLLDKLLGATLHHYPLGEDEAGADRRMAEVAAELRAAGRNPYQISLAPEHKPLGALGYVRAAAELLAQCDEFGVDFDEVVVPSGSGHTHAGLLFGLKALGFAGRVTGVCVRRDAAGQRSRIESHCRQIAGLLDMRSPVMPGDVHLLEEFLVPGYGYLNDPTLEAIRLGARTEALMLDPIYTGKAMAGFIARVRELGAGRSTVFVHTGGLPVMFAYEPLLSETLDGVDA